MVFIIYSGVGDSAIQHSLGKAEYSYFFLLQAFRPMLARTGRVEEVTDPQREVDVIYRACQEQNEDCLFLCFTPPNLAPVDLACPTLCVFAWEFGSLPDYAWDNNPYQDWRKVFSRHGACIASSNHTASVVRAAMGEDFPVAALPAPVWDKFASVRDAVLGHPAVRRADIQVRGFVYDSSQVAFTPENLIPALFSRRPEAVAVGEHTDEGEDVPDVAPPEHTDFSYEGVVYTSVFNPLDGRKAYYDIVTAFCTAFREQPEAVLLLKMTHTDPDTYRHNLNHMLHQLWPFKCRVIAFNGFLDQDDYQALIRSTAYYVNASHCEGLCLPLLEFMSCGVPAIAPRHTAMADYIDSQVAFELRSSIELNVWPNDSRNLYTTTRYRNDWSSLVEAYKNSMLLANNDQKTYADMSAAAIARMEGYCSSAAVENRFYSFLASSNRINS